MSDKPIASSLLRQEGPQQEAAQGALREVMDELREVGEILRAKPEQSVIDAARETVLALDISEALRGRPLSTPKPAPSDLLARLRDYHDQVLKGFRHISRLEEADLIQAAIDGLRQNTPMARLRGSLPAEESDADFDAAVAEIRAVPPAEGEK